MDKNCKIVQDLIPLCAEKIASSESIEFVKNHCETCESCKKIYKFSGIDIAKKEKEYDDKMQKIWENIERQEKAKKHKKIIFSSICGGLVSLLIFFYIFSCFHGTIWTIGYNNYPLSETSEKYFSQFPIYVPTEEEISEASEVLKEHFKENNKGEILTSLMYDEYMNYNTNYENYKNKIYKKSICFKGSILNNSDILKNVIVDATKAHKWKVDYIPATDSWEVSSITSTVTIG